MVDTLLVSPWWVLILILIVATATIWLVVWPLVWVLLYGIGSTIFHLLTIDWRKAKTRPLTFAKYLFWKWPGEGMKEAIIWPADKVTNRSWEWRPLFKYRKREG